VTTYLVTYKVSATKRQIVIASDEDEASERAAENLKLEFCIGDHELDLYDIREAKGNDD
jgi:hypothetical protein